MECPREPYVANTQYALGWSVVFLVFQNGRRVNTSKSCIVYVSQGCFTQDFHLHPFYTGIWPFNCYSKSTLRVRIRYWCGGLVLLVFIKLGRSTWIRGSFGA